MANYATNVWQDDPVLIQEGGGWWTAIGVVQGDGKPFIRVARGRAVPGNDPETNCPIKQQQKFNVKSAERAEAVADALRDLANQI